MKIELLKKNQSSLKEAFMQQWMAIGRRELLCLCMYNDRKSTNPNKSFYATDKHTHTCNYT